MFGLGLYLLLYLVYAFVPSCTDSTWSRLLAYGIALYQNLMRWSINLFYILPENIVND